jgi:poly(3-hydroxybutyrate) depolymerase
MGFQSLFGVRFAAFLVALACTGTVAASPGAERPAAPPMSGILLGKDTGGSTAACTPDPCTAGTVVTHDVISDDGVGNLIDRTYRVYRPVGLTNSPINKVPAVFFFNQGLFDRSDWRQQAVANRFLLVYMPRRAGAGGYFWPQMNPNQAFIDLFGACGLNCDDKPWLLQVLGIVMDTENIDPDKVFATGSSKGGFPMAELACVPSVSRFFRAFSMHSATLFSTGSSYPPPPNCAPANTDFSWQLQFGGNDGLLCGFPAQAGCVRGLPHGFVNINGFWELGVHETSDFMRQVLGCTSTTTTTSFGFSGGLTRETYETGCASQYRAAELVTIPHGGHSYNGLDHVRCGCSEGFNSAADAWTFFATH